MSSIAVSQGAPSRGSFYRPASNLSIDGYFADWDGDNFFYDIAQFKKLTISSRDESYKIHSYPFSLFTLPSIS